MATLNIGHDMMNRTGNYTSEKKPSRFCDSGGVHKCHDLLLRAVKLRYCNTVRKYHDLLTSVMWSHCSTKF